LKVHDSQAEPWKITLVDTGNETMTGGRIKRIQQHVGNETFMLTYGDGVCDVDVSKLLEFHKQHGKICTVTSVQPSGRFGVLNISEDNTVHSFTEKPKGDGAWINGGYFVCEPEVFDYIKEGDATIWEKGPMDSIAAEGKMVSYKHDGFWRPMDTLKDKQDLNEAWESNQAPWKTW
jgi:glucose-1-phosphate cytidylyltransferase